MASELKRKAAKGVARPDVLDLLDPGGRSILSQAVPRDKKNGWILKNLSGSTEEQ